METRGAFYTLWSSKKILRPFVPRGGGTPLAPGLIVQYDDGVLLLNYHVQDDDGMKDVLTITKARADATEAAAAADIADDEPIAVWLFWC